MLLTSNYIYPSEVTGYVREALADFEINRFTLSSFLPSENIDDIEYRVAAGGTGLADAAVYRSYDAEAPVGRRQPLSSMIGELPPISEKLRSSEYEQLRLRKLADEAIRNALFNDAGKAVRDIAARIEYARGQTLINGATPIPELGVTVNWGRTPAHTVTAATLWSSTTPVADILSDLMSWRDTYLNTNAVDPGTLVVSRRIWNVMLRNQSVRNQVFPGSNQPSIVTTANLNAMLLAEGLPEVVLYQAQVNISAVATRVIPDNILLMLPPAVDGSAQDNGLIEDTQLGGVFWGTTMESQEPGYGLEGDEPGIVAGVYSEVDPVSLWTKAAAIAMPVMPNPNLSLAATVL